MIKLIIFLDYYVDGSFSSIRTITVITNSAKENY